MRDLRPLLVPRSVAILGASSRATSVAGRPLANLLQVSYSGALYPINPQRDEIAGLRSYPSLDALPEVPELALIVVPQAHVLAAVEQCAERGVRAAIVISAGFAEAGAEGVRAQQRMGEVARASGMIVCGPNSLGLLNYVDRVPLSFTTAGDMLKGPAGRIGFVSQSGGLMTTIANRACDAGIGVSRAVATGNEADLTVAEVLEYLADDPATDACVVLLEPVRDGPRFLAVCDKLLECGKPLVAYKIGRSAAGAAAAASHTGALAGSYAPLQAVFRQRGLIEAQDTEDLFDLAAAAAAGRYPAGNGVAITTSSGGAGAIAADEAEERGLAVVPFGPATVERLQALVPAYGSGAVVNPFDLGVAIGDATVESQTAAAVLDDPAVDALVLCTPGVAEPGRQSAEHLAGLAAATPKPALPVILGGSHSAAARAVLREARVPVFASPRKAVLALDGLRRFARARAAQAAAPAPNAAPLEARVRRLLEQVGPRPTEHDAKRFLAQVGVPVVEEYVAQSADEAVRCAELVGYPVALKVLSPDITHKTEVGGVRLGLADADAVRAAYDAVLASGRAAAPVAAITGALVSAMLPTPLELIAGVHTDPTFGPLVLFGLGGIWVEVYGDVAMRPAPLRPGDAAAMLAELRGAALLQGARSLPPVAPEAIERLLLALSDLAVGSAGLLAGVDVNPLVPTADGELVALDATLYLAPPETQ
ncbi:MAG TPA: acetate--CoA ligase family protein [Chloroflexota bacterium]|jgi:acyl-CoA synthetase (NDP forming)